MLIERFIKGYKHFQSEVFPQQRQAFAQLAEGQHPPVLLITCSDSRIVPHLVFQADPGELFIVRNAGNIVPPYEAAQGAEAAAIEYAVMVLKIRHIVVCGHSRCGAMQALLSPASVQTLPAVKAWIGFGPEAPVPVEGEDAAASLDRLIQRNVRLQLEHLRTHPSVISGLENRTLHLHGWVYRFEKGELIAYDEEADTFTSLGAPSSSNDS